MRWLCISFLAILLSACSRTEAPRPTGQPQGETRATQPQKAPAHPERATAELAPTQGNTANGSIALMRTPQGVHITGEIQGLKPNGEFGFHIHEKGDCSAADASSAGAHFNPGGQPHGAPTSPAHHAGDLPNIHSDSKGVAIVDATTNDVTLSTGQPNDVLGKAIIVHEHADDYTSQPAGNSGGRIACGVIASAIEKKPPR